MFLLSDLPQKATALHRYQTVHMVCAMFPPWISWICETGTPSLVVPSQAATANRKRLREAISARKRGSVVSSSEGEHQSCVMRQRCRLRAP